MNITPLHGFHIGGPLLEDGFFGYIDPRGAADRAPEIPSS
jgi:hypothetical protein